MGEVAFFRTDELLSLCGLNCSLCPLFVRGDCVGCRAGSWCAQSCGFVPCSVRHGGITHCFECPECPCRRFVGVDKRDSLISHKNQLKDMEKAKQMGIDCYHEEQREKVAMLHRLLDEFDDGEHDVFFCLAANLLAVPDFEGALVRAGAKACGGEAHERAACAEAELRHVARERGIALELRTWDEPW